MQSFYSLVCTQRNMYTGPPKDRYLRANIPNSQILETTQMPISSRINRASPCKRRTNMRGPLPLMRGTGSASFLIAGSHIEFTLGKFNKPITYTKYTSICVLYFN